MARTGYDDETRERALRLSCEGLNDIVVAREVGVSQKTIGAWRREARIPANGTRSDMEVPSISSYTAPVSRPCVETDPWSGSVINQRGRW
jgi:transposase-like protein